MVSYFSALGSVLFSVSVWKDPMTSNVDGKQYLYALISVAVAQESFDPDHSDLTEAPTICYGSKCFKPSLWVATACAVVASAGFIFISKRWKA